MALTFGGAAAGGLLTPQPEAIASVTNYTDLVTLGTDSSINKQLPDAYNQLVERFGVQSIQGFLAKTSAEFPLKSDKIEWAEEGRLHLFYEGATYDADGGAGSSARITFADGDDHAIRVGQVILVDDGDEEIVARVNATAVPGASDGGSVDVDFYSSDSGISEGDGAITVRVIGSEFAKGTTGMTGSVESQAKWYDNAPSILKDRYAVSGSDTAQIGWIQVSGGSESAPFGQGGWLWYLKSEMDNRSRFMDYLETHALEARTGASGSDIVSVDGAGNTEGVFQKIDTDGINTTTAFDDSSWTNFSADIDSLLKELDVQGAIQENLMYLNRDESLAIDNGLALANSYGSGGQTWGAFANSEDMAIKLMFKSFSRGSYTFHKTDWKYLNDLTGRNKFTNGVRGILTPSGSMNVYDQGIGGTAKRPFIHVRYRQSQADNRKLKSWITGSVGASNSTLDAMELHYLSERCTVVQGANNFILFK